MPTGQQYATNVPQTTLTGLINATATVASVNSSSGWPTSFPFTAILDIGTSLQEPVDVTNITGTTWTITRAIDGTTGFTHGVGATVTHGDIGRDFREPRAHIDSVGPTDTTGKSVHGLTTGVVVGTLETQSLSNKTLVAPTMSGAVAMGSGAWTGTGTLAETALTATGITGAAVQNARLAGSTASGPPTTGTFITGDIVMDQLGNQWMCTAGGTPGTWFPAGGRALISRLSGTSATYNFAIPASMTPNRVEVFWRGNSTAAVHNQVLSLRLNGNSGTNYQFERTESNNTTVAAATFTGMTNIQIASIGGTSNSANYKGSGHFVVDGMQDGVGFSTAYGTATMFDTSANMFHGTYSGQFTSGGPITSITVFPASGSWDTSSFAVAYAVY